MILSLQIVVLGPENVPPAYFILCRILLTVSRYSKTNFNIPGFCSRVSTLPSGSSYLVFGPLIGMSSIYSKESLDAICVRATGHKAPGESSVNITVSSYDTTHL